MGLVPAKGLPNERERNMLSESSTSIDYFGAEKLMADGQYLAAADAYYSCWARFQSADFIQDTEYQVELANDALDSCILVFKNHLTPEEQQGFLDKHGMMCFDDLLYADKGS